MTVNHYDYRHYYKSMARMLDHEERVGSRKPRVDSVRVAAWAIEDCEAGGRVSPKEINEAVESAVRALQKELNEENRKRLEEYRLQHLRERFGDYTPWDETKHRRDLLGRFTTTGGGYEFGKMSSRERIESQINLRQGAQRWDRDGAIEYLQRKAKPASSRRCGEYVSKAIEAGGIRLNRELNPTRTRTNREGSAYGYGPVLIDAGFVIMPGSTTPQAGDVAVFPQSRGHEHGHIAMFNGREWISDFKQLDIYGSRKRREDKIEPVIYRRP